ncbi:RGA2 [Sanghuangporus sanghuang]
MLAALPGVPPQQAQRSVNAQTLEDDRLCAGCSKSVSSDTGGVVVAFGNSLWHVDCFKCAKCGNQVNADTNLLLLSDGSPVCANCYNCKVCKLPILDEAVMTGDDSFHAECFTCRSCKNRIDELVFAKTSQGFYCMKCHNERVARSRRHLAKHKQRERERAGLASSSGRSATSTTADGSASRPKEGEHANTAPVHPDVSRAKHASDDVSSSDSHGQAFTSSQAGSRSSHGTFGESGAPGPSNLDRSASPAPPAVSVTAAGPSSEQGARDEPSYSQSRLDSHAQENQTSGDLATDRRPSIDVQPPPPYSKTSPPAGGNSDVESARSSASYNASNSTEPTSPSISVSASQEGSFNDHCAPSQDSSSLSYANSGGRERSSSLTPREGAGWPGLSDEENRRRSHDESRPSQLQLIAGGVAGLSVSKRREKRNSVNPGLQLEASKMMQYHTPKRPGTAPSTSPGGSTPGSAPSGSFARTHSPTGAQGGRDSPRLTSPLREYFTNIEEDSSSSTTVFYSPSSSPQPRGERPASPRSAPVTTRSQTAPAPAISTSPPTRRDVFANIFPQRSDSLKGTGSSSSALGTGSTPSSAPRANGLPSSPYNGRLNAPATLRSQRSFDDRGGRLSPRKAEFGDGSGMKRSRSASPMPPDVPRSIESGTDTETDNGNDSDELIQNYMDRSTDTLREKRVYTAPALPPKDSMMESNGRSGSQSSSQPNSAGLVGGDELDKGDVEETAVTHRTSGFFMTPALPPMRFSMSGTDFNELLSNLGGSASVKRLSLLAGARKTDDAIPEEKSEELDVATARTPTSLASTITPQRDMIASEENSNPNSDLSASSSTMVKLPRRQQSVRGKRNAPPEPIVVHSNSERAADVSSSGSPNSSSHSDGHRIHRRGSSKAEASTPRSSAESRHPTTLRINVNDVNGHRRSESNGAVPGKQDAAELVTRRLKEALADATERQADYIKLDRAFVEAIVQGLDQKRDQVAELSSKVDSMKRASQMIFDGLEVAEDEFKQELAARRTAEEEVSRLKIEVSGQAARITALSGEERRRDVQKRFEKELHENLNGLEKDLSKLKVERDMTLAEVEELSASKSSLPNGDAQGTNVGRSLTMRLDNIKRQYQHELIPLTQQKEALVREIADLKEARDVFLEETAVLNARNEQLAQLNQQYERRIEPGHSRDKSLPPVQQESQRKVSFDKFDSWKTRQAAQAAPAQPIINTTSTSSTATLIDDAAEARQQRPSKLEPNEAPTRRIGLRWPGAKANKDVPVAGMAAFDNAKGKKRVEHMFQQLSILRFARCDLCGDKMWGSQVRCSVCNMSVHVRCVGQVQASCAHDGSTAGPDDHLAPIVAPPPSMFGRDLIEQVREDAKTSKNSELFVPIIVDKCIDAVEANAMDYEGIYRKTGGSGQSKAITALFERGDYASFNLSDSEAFNDVSSVTSVMKNYFRSLPNPLLTFGMHEAFVAAAHIKDPSAKGQALKDLVKQLPAEHYHTLSRLMLHLHRIQLNADVNLMNARNLGVIFGPTLMRSADPSREFADMAGKSLAIEYLIENAPSVFPLPSS